MIVRKNTYLADVKITVCDYSFVLSETQKRIKEKRAFLVSPIASYTIAKASQEPVLKKTLSKFSLLVPDGYWVKRALEWKYGYRIRERVYGPSLTLQLLALAHKNRYRVAFYGTTDKTLQRLKKEIEHNYPGLEIVAMIPSVFRPIRESEFHALVRKLNDCKPDMLFIGIGSPLQEEFAVHLAHETKPHLIPVSVFTVGAAFDFIARTKRQAPDWVGRNGFEWLFRLLQEPGRLWKRYLLYGCRYMFLMLKDIVRHRIRS